MKPKNEHKLYKTVINFFSIADLSTNCKIQESTIIFDWVERSLEEK